jgi:hypothetical protein
LWGVYLPCPISLSKRRLLNMARGNPNFGKKKTDENTTIEKVNAEEIEVARQSTEPTWKPDLTRMICVKNIARGKLVYKSKRQMGYTLEWALKGDSNYMELGEFISLKNSDRRFVTEPWIRVVEDDEIEILKYAQVFEYYKEILGLNNVSDILNLKFELFKKKFDKLPEGYKNSVVEQAAEMIKDGTLDSIKIKNYIEETMGIDLSILTSPVKKKKNESINIK